MNKLFLAFIAFYGQGMMTCPDGGGWVALGESCYLISMEHFGWANAQIVTITQAITISLSFVLQVLYGAWRILG